MEFEKFKKWLDLAGQNPADHFWNQVFAENNQLKMNQKDANSFFIAGSYIPISDLYKVEDQLIVDVELPGLKKEDIHLSIHHQLLSITGEFKTFQPQNKYFLKERANRKFKKEITLPFPIQIHSVCSELKNGVLTIKMRINQEEVETVPIIMDESNFE